MAKEKTKAKATATRRPTRQRTEDPVEIVMRELLARHPHLQAASDAMHLDETPRNQFAELALSEFRQRFQN